MKDHGKDFLGNKRDVWVRRWVSLTQATEEMAEVESRHLEAGGDFVVIQTFILFKCKLVSDFYHLMV